MFRPKLKSLSAEEKLMLISDLERGKSRGQLCHEFNIANSTLCGIMRNREKILSQCADGAGKSRRKRPPKYPDLEERLSTWIQQLQQENVSITGPMIKGKAQEFARELDIKNFSSSNGWLGGFKKRNKFLKCFRTQDNIETNESHIEIMNQYVASNVNNEQCLICSEKQNTMISLRQVLIDCDQLTIVEVLKELQFLIVPDVKTLQRTICCVCVAKIHNCFEFKTLCARVEQELWQHSPYRPKKSWLESRKAKRVKLNDNQHALEAAYGHQLDDTSAMSENPNTAESPRIKCEVEDVSEATYFVDVDEGIFKKDNFIGKTCDNDEESAIQTKAIRKSYVCHVCHKSFLSKTKCKEHQLLHSIEKTQKNFKYRNHSQTHSVSNDEQLENYTSLSQEPNFPGPTVAYSDTKPLVCPYCKKIFFQKQNFLIHLRYHSIKKSHKSEHSASSNQNLEISTIASVT